MNFAPETTVRELALSIPGATRVFEKFGIDYCCGGLRSVNDACQSAGVSVASLMNSLESAAQRQLPAEDFDAGSGTASQLIDHIIETHHVFTRNEIQRLRDLLNKVNNAHGQNHPELKQLLSEFETLGAELEPHMMKEERILFPYIKAMENAISNTRAIKPPLFGSVNNPVRVMMLEHEGAGHILGRMRQLTSDYTLPADACISFKTLYEALVAFEKDLHQHIHLENNILFPRSIELEKELLT